MTVTFDAVANLGTSHSTSGFSGSFTLGTSATALCVLVGGYGSAFGQASLTTHTAKVGTTSMVLLRSIDCNNTAGNGWVEVWGLIAPPTGAQTITVVENDGSTAAYLNVTAISFNGVSQFGTPVANYGAGATTTSGAIVSGTGSRVLTVTGAYNGVLGSATGSLRSNMPASATVDYVTMLVQDAAGATTVTNTTSFTGSSGWADISVNLVVGHSYSIAAPLALTAGRAAGGSFVGRVWHVGAHLSLTTAGSAGGSWQAQGPPLRYVGRPPDSPSVVGTATYAQSEDAANLVTPTWIGQQVTQAVKNLVTPAWVAEQAAEYLPQSTVTAALSSYIPDSELGATNGIAVANGSGTIPSAQLPTLVTNNLAQAYDAVAHGTVFLPTATTYTVTTENIGEFVLANVVIPNPGYPWIPLPFGYVLGYSSATPSGSRLVGNGDVGFLAVTVPGETTPVYGMGLMTADTLPNYYPIVPSVDGLASISPFNQPALQGGATLQLSACNFSGSSYTVSGSGLVFYVLVLPALGGGS